MGRWRRTGRSGTAAPPCKPRPPRLAVPPPAAPPQRLPGSRGFRRPTGDSVLPGSCPRRQRRARTGSLDPYPYRCKSRRLCPCVVHYMTWPDHGVPLPGAPCWTSGGCSGAWLDQTVGSGPRSCTAGEGAGPRPAPRNPAPRVLRGLAEEWRRLGRHAGDGGGVSVVVQVANEDEDEGMGKEGKKKKERRRHRWG